MSDYQPRRRPREDDRDRGQGGAGRSAGARGGTGRGGTGRGGTSRGGTGRGGTGRGAGGGRDTGGYGGNRAAGGGRDTGGYGGNRTGGGGRTGGGRTAGYGGSRTDTPGRGRTGDARTSDARSRGVRSGAVRAGGGRTGDPRERDSAGYGRGAGRGRAGGRPQGPPRSPQGKVWGSLARSGGGYRTTRPRERDAEHGDEPRGPRGGYEEEVPRSVARAATTGRNLWQPDSPRSGERRPGRPTGDGRSAARGLGGEQVEGRQAVRELLAAKRRQVKEIWMTEGSDPSPILGEIDTLARDAKVPVRLVSARRLETVQATETPQGVIAFAAPLDTTNLEALVTEPTLQAPPFVVVLDGVTDPQNVGAVIRSAECAGAAGIVIPKHRAAHVTAAVTKAAAGAVEHLAFALVAGVPSALQELSDLGVMTVGLDEHGEKSIFDLEIGDKAVALVLGAEGHGISQLARRRCDVLAHIPLKGSIPSLNVSAAAAIACFELTRQRSAATKRS